MIMGHSIWKFDKNMKTPHSGWPSTWQYHKAWLPSLRTTLKTAVTTLSVWTANSIVVTICVCVFATQFQYCWFRMHNDTNVYIYWHRWNLNLQVDVQHKNVAWCFLSIVPELVTVNYGLNQSSWMVWKHFSFPINSIHNRDQGCLSALLHQTLILPHAHLRRHASLYHQSKVDTISAM